MKKTFFSVMIVDDDQQIINLLSSAVKKNLGQDAKIIVVHNEAIIAHSEEVDVVLVEFSLPSMNCKPDNIRTKGLEIIRQLKNKNPETIIIAMSSYAQKGSSLLAAGANYFIASTYDGKQLSNLLKNIRK